MLLYIVFWSCGVKNNTNPAVVIKMNTVHSHMSRAWEPDYSQAFSVKICGGLILAWDFGYSHVLEGQVQELKNDFFLTIMILSFGQAGPGKQCRPRSDCSSGFTLFAIHLHLLDVLLYGRATNIVQILL